MIGFVGAVIGAAFPFPLHSLQSSGAPQIYLSAIFIFYTFVIPGKHPAFTIRLTLKAES